MSFWHLHSYPHYRPKIHATVKIAPVRQNRTVDVYLKMKVLTIPPIASAAKIADATTGANVARTALVSSHSVVPLRKFSQRFFLAETETKNIRSTN